jgi:hypothetical protein
MESVPGWLAIKVQVPEVIRVIERSLTLHTDGVEALMIGLREYSEDDTSDEYKLIEPLSRFTSEICLNEIT